MCRDRGEARPPKDLAIEAIRRLPADATLPEIVASLTVLSRIEEGLRQLDLGQGLDHEEVKRRLARRLD
jgi:hypothetical protein